MTTVHDDQARAARLLAARALVGDLLASHPEARSLLSEASHWRGLAAHSAAVAAAASRAADLARLRSEELRHRLDPRGHRRGRYGVACALVAAIGVVLAGLARIELAPWIDVTGRPAGWLVATAVAAVWLSGAWLAATSGHPRRVLLTAAAVALAALLAALAVADVVAGSRRRLAAVLYAVLSALLAVIAAALIARAEPVTLAQGALARPPRRAAPRCRGGHRAGRRRDRRRHQGKLARPGPRGHRGGRRGTGPRGDRYRGGHDLVPRPSRGTGIPSVMAPFGALVRPGRRGAG